MAKANLALLGGIRLQTDAGEPVPLSTKKVGALLAYLALHPRQVQARPKLAALLWGDRSDVPARDSLRQSLSLLRKALSRIDPHALVAHEDTITFTPTALTTDAIVFADLVARDGAENLEQAVALYGGELLEGFQVRAPEFESWLTAERERFRELASQAMTRLLDHHLSMGAVESGIRVAARLLAADPMQEQVHRSLMELYYRQGRHGAALRQYRICADVLAKELGIEPDAATKALRREIMRKWNQQEGTTANDNAAVKSIADVEAAPPATSRPPERRQVTVLVCDLVGMSALAARLDPEELQALMAAYQRCCMPIISQYGGTVGKLAGAEMLTYFGYPQAHEHDVERALHAGLSLIRAVSRLDGGNAGVLRLSVGIATGPVVIGDLPGHGANQPGIIGEAAQLAGWLQTFAAPDTVVIAESTRRLVGSLFDCNELGQIIRNGSAQPISAWRVLGPSGIDSRFEAWRTTATPLIGRDEELELLQRRWRQTANGQGRVVLLSGEAGIGKSRLAVELQERLPANSHTRARYFCSPHHQNTALYPFISQLQRAAGFRRDDDDRQRLDKLEAILARAASDIDDAVPLIADLLSLPTSDRHPPLELTPQKRKEKTLRTLLAQLEGLAAREPVLMVFEDVHWIDPTSLELLDLNVDRVANLPVLLIITFRPEFAPAWVGRPHVTLLTINRLLPLERAEMIAGLTDGKALPEEIAEQIIDRTDGVPLFIEELTKAVLEGGLAGPAGDRQTAAGSRSQPAIPWTLHTSLLARLDRVASVKEIAQIGAAVGREFTYSLIAEVAALPDRNLEAALAQLVNAGLVFQRGVPPDATYLFKHALVQDVAYASLARDRRRELHARIATVLEQQLPDIADRQPAVVAHHCTEAGLVAKAITYWGKAGRKSVAQASMVEAAVQLRKGLDLVATLPASTERWRQELELQTALGAALLASQGHGAPEVGDVYARAHALGERLGEAEALVPILGGQFSFHLQRSEYALGRQIAEKLLRLADERDDLAGRVVGHRAMGVCMHQLGAFAAAAAHFDQVLELYAPEEHQSIAAVAGFDPRAAALRYRAFGELICGRCDQALSRMVEMMRWSRTLGHPYIMVHALNWMASFQLLRGDLAAAVAPLEELLTLADPKCPLWLSLGQINRGWLLAQSGEPGDGLALARKGFETMIAIGSTWNQTYYRGMLAQICEWAARPGEAMDELTTALSIADQTGEQWFEPELRRLMGEWVVRHRPSALPDAEAHLQRAIAVAREQNAKLWELRATTSLGHLWCKQGRLDEALATLAPIFGWFTEGLDLPDCRAAGALSSELERRLPSLRSKTNVVRLTRKHGGARYVDPRK